MTDSISPSMSKAYLNAYAQAQSMRSVRSREADIFRRVIWGLKEARKSGERMQTVRAISDARRLWGVVHDSVVHPENHYPDQLKASLASIALTVLREVQSEEPDLDFLISVTASVGEGLDDAPSSSSAENS
ncbi:flagellar biosynthesis regulator FlaF [Fodinicurvata fenggangensis]|uniref:flagellar biosynthesis regulator FlaF n=1 Tax=Fodinicurvata fenggangensis TaxID=1121830 RepID=UPI0012DD2DB9|nr:flagellar biosynthesis regulator FlaF [Fodinicurvata fenggangensis]